MPKRSSFKHEKADDSPGFLLWKITALWQKKLAEVLGQFGITQTQFAMLASLKWFEEKKEPTTQTHLVDHTKIDKMTLSKAIRKLEESNLVLRATSSVDSRATNIRFTALGKTLIQQAVVAVENADDEFFSCLSEKQLKGYKSLTSAVISFNAQ
jgi:MarR family transcriptional regulator, transcriptional regulator for hemolysin